jgi:hypothetical protein
MIMFLTPMMRSMRRSLRERSYHMLVGIIDASSLMLVGIIDASSLYMLSIGVYCVT